MTDNRPATNRHIHVVTFQYPDPPTYGGVIDVYWRLRAMKQRGWNITLHTFAYGDRKSPNLAQSHLIADKVIVYPRKTGLRSQLSTLPYIVNSRRCDKLILDLLVDNDPILFEGVHTCHLLADKRLKSRKKIVRMHNVEHHYYLSLARSVASPIKKLFYTIEATRLKRYLETLTHADAIGAISVDDLNYLKSHLPATKSFLLPPFFDDSANTPTNSNIERKPYVLFHGNLAVEENSRALLWIIEKIAPRLPEVDFVFAGANPSTKISNRISSTHNAQLIENPSIEVMNSLVTQAQVTLLITFQSTGIKLKLINSLQNGAHVIANSHMVKGSGLESLCSVADTPDEIVTLIKTKLAEPFAGRQHLPENKKSLELLESFL